MENKKRSADATFETPDAKRKVLDLNESIEEDQAVHRKKEPVSASKHQEPGGILVELAKKIYGPYAAHDKLYIEVLSNDMAPYFATLYYSLLGIRFPSGAPIQQLNVITEAQFILVCRYFVKARCDAVFGKVSGRRTQTRIPVASVFQLPKALADIINGIGTIIVNDGGLNVCPQPEADNDPDPQQRLSALVNHNILTAFENLVLACRNIGGIHVSTVSQADEGTAWWLLSARQTTNHTVVCNGLQDNVTVLGVFKEWTPSDAAICAIVQRQNDGLFGGIDEMFWTTDPARSIGATRRAFNIQA